MTKNKDDYSIDEDRPSIEELDAGQRILEDLYAKAVMDRRQGRDAPQNTGPTAVEIAREISNALSPHFGHMTFKAQPGPHIGPEDSVYVTYASVPKGSPEIDALNASSNPMISINRAPGSRWPRGNPSPAKLKTEMFRGSIGWSLGRGSAVKFRAKTDTPAKIAKYVIDFFLKNKEILLKNEKR